MNGDFLSSHVLLCAGVPSWEVFWFSESRHFQFGVQHCHVSEILVCPGDILPNLLHHALELILIGILVKAFKNMTIHELCAALKSFFALLVLCPVQLMVLVSVSMLSPNVGIFDVWYCILLCPSFHHVWFFILCHLLQPS